MRLLVVGVTVPPETFIGRKLEGLAARGVTVILATTTPRKEFKGSLGEIRVLRLPNLAEPSIVRAVRLLKDLILLMVESRHGFSCVRDLIKAALSGGPRPGFARMCTYVPLARQRPDIVHFEWNNLAVKYLPMFEVWKRPVVISCRGTMVNIRPHHPDAGDFVEKMRDSFQRSTAVHCVSDDILREATKYGVASEKGVVIRPAVDTERFTSAVLKPGASDSFRVVSVGSLIWRKGYEYSLQAIRRLVDRGVPVKYHICGDGTERQLVRYTTQDLNLDAVVHLHGSLPEEKVIEQLQIADVYLLSSVSEGISNGVLEAMSCGIPVVTTDCGGMREAVTDGVEGLVVPVRDPDAIADAIERLYRDPAMRKTMGRDARERVIKDFSLEKQLESWLDLYQSVIER